MYTFNREAYNRRMEWYLDARFGMFIHWGLYSIAAREEWLRSTEEITKEDYMKYFEEFDPCDYDPKAWARAAKEAGMKYAVQIPISFWTSFKTVSWTWLWSEHLFQNLNWIFYT